ncbi:MAG TPA: 2,3-bisphosphoglycerate-independent phosphoglycerate mutase [Thermodesulfobacteriota bacterium]|nr:2,3-bisphosphoglycerate-independent phosphoglycerate mutase [Thermodesulfobacteriota bacterium]
MQEIIREILEPGDSKIVLCVMDGLGGLPVNGKTELEAASTPNLDKLARDGACGLHLPVALGITPGSGAAHLGLFGYDPLKYEIGRGVLEALGLGIEFSPNDVAIRGNFATVKYEGDKPVVVDRRAGRIPTEENKRIVAKIREKVQSVDGVKVSVTSGMEHRLVLLLTFPHVLPGGADDISDTDPQKEGKSPLKPLPRRKDAEQVASAIDKFVGLVAEVIRDEPVANYILLRGVSQYPKLPHFSHVYGVKAAAIASYPMYRGVAKLVGMEVLEVADTTIRSEIETLKRQFHDFDFFYLHVKKTDSYGEDGNFGGKVKVIEEFDSFIPEILDLNPAVLVVTGDHSTPASMKSHSWHPVPFLLYSSYARGVDISGFSEKECLKGELGTFLAKDAMTFMLAHARRLQKYGA